MAPMEQVELTEEQWREKLTPEQFDVLRRQGTERAFSGAYWNVKEDGIYRCAGCDAELFDANTKFDSGTGWPSFTDPIVADSVVTHEDSTFGMRRIEADCKRCGGHLGHVFPDGPGDSGQRWCINSASLKLDPRA